VAESPKTLQPGKASLMGISGSHVGCLLGRKFYSGHHNPNESKKAEPVKIPPFLFRYLLACAEYAFPKFIPPLQSKAPKVFEARSSRLGQPH